MTPTPIDLDALARETAWKATDALFDDGHPPKVLASKATMSSTLQMFIRAALAQVVPTGELRSEIRAEAEAIIAHEPVAFAECTVAEDVMARARRIVELTK